MEFKVGKMKAHVVQVAGTLHNHGPVAEINQVAESLRRIRELAAAEGAVEIEEHVQEAEIELAQPEPRQGLVAAALERIKSLALGLTSAAEIAESADRILTVVQGAG